MTCLIFDRFLFIKYLCIAKLLVNAKCLANAKLVANVKPLANTEIFRDTNLFSVVKHCVKCFFGINENDGRFDRFNYLTQNWQVCQIKVKHEKLLCTG